MPATSVTTRIKKTKATGSDDAALHLAFYKTAQANIISIVSNGKIVIANNAACKLLGYSKKEILTKNRKTIFDIKETGFKKMLKQRTAEGHSVALVTLIKKTGKHISCEITSAVFMDEKGIEKSITSITDISRKILEQKKIDIKKDKIVAGNILVAKSKQKEIDIKKEKIVTDNIAIVELKQKKTDAKNEQTVADNIGIAVSKQKVIDVKNEKIVAENIAIAESKQKKTDAKNRKKVADNIGIAVSKQKAIDVKKEKIVAENIAIVELKQKKTDAKNEQIVAADIVTAQAKFDYRQMENDKWIRYIAMTSYDVMWDWDIESGQVYIGDSIEEIFGYKLKNNTIHISDLNHNFLAEEHSRVEEGLVKALSSGSTWEDSFKIRCHDGSIASVNSRGGIIRNAEGKAVRLIGATQDISKMLKLEKELGDQVSVNENADIFHLAAKLSYDGMWDWNILTNEFFLGEGFGEIFGHSFAKGTKNFDWVSYLHPDDREAVETGLFTALASSATHWEHAYRFVKADGSFANVFGRANIIRDADGKACRMIGVIHDLSRQQELEKKLEQEIASNGKLLTEYNESFRLMFNSSSDILYDIDVVTNEIVLSEGYEKEFGYKIVPHMKPGQVWKAHLHPEDKEAILKEYQRMLATEETRWKCSYRFLRSDGSVANIVSSRIILRNGEGKAYRMIGSMQDISKQKVLEEKLEQEIRFKEKQIADAMEDAKEAERSDLGKELHDNVNQLLGVSRLYVEMAKQGGDKSEMYLQRSSEYTLSAIEEIRKLTKGLTTDTIRHLGLCESIENLSRDAMQVNPLNILCTLDLQLENLVTDRFKLNMFRIIQEQLNNILKHAHAKKVIINLSQKDQSILLVISDDGVGFDATQRRRGIGIDNIKSRAAAYNGKADFASEPEAGCVLTVVFTLNDAL